MPQSPATRKLTAAAKAALAKARAAKKVPSIADVKEEVAKTGKKAAVRLVAGIAFGLTFRALRHAKALTQAEAGRAIGESTRTINRWERGAGVKQATAAGALALLGAARQGDNK